MPKKNCPLDENVVQIGVELPEMHNTSRELRNAFVDVVKVRFVEIKYMEYLFNDVLEIKNGKNQKLVENPEGLYPIYGSGGIIGYADKYICEANTVIIGRKGSINNPIYVSEPFWNVDTAFGLSPKQDILLPRYLFYFCKNYNFEKLNKTVTIPSLTKADLLKIQIDLPSIDEQRRIVDKLIKVETIINLRNYQVQQLDDLIKARFIELFGDPQRNPHGYKHTKLSDIATYYNGLTYKPENVATEGTIVLRSSNIQNSQLDFADTVRVDCAIKERLMVQKNDILMCSRNGSAKLVGKVALIKDIQEPMSFGAFMMIIRSHYFGYLMTYFQMDAFRQQIKTGATTTINQITGRMLDDVTIPLPPMSLVDQFATFVEQIDKSKLLSGCRLFHSWAPENRDKPKHVGVPQRKTKVLRGGRRQQ